MAPDETADAGLIADAQPEAFPDAPERRCILTGAHGSRDQLIRLVPGPDGVLWPDLAARLPGRGAWVTADKPALETAIAKGRLRGALARAFKGKAPAVPEDLPARIESGLARRTLDRLGLEHRAGHLLFGSDRIGEAARAGKLALLLHASDAADDGCAKLDQAFRVGGGDVAQVIHLPADRESLSRALGRDNMVHSGVTDGKAAARIMADVARWIAYLRPDMTAPATDAAMRNTNGGGNSSGRQNDEGRE